MSQTKKTCHYCGEEILAVAIKCKHCGSMLVGNPVGNPGGASQDEEILADVVANLFRGIEGVGGRLKITNRRVIFEPHAFNFQNMPAEILLGDIAEVSTRSTMGLIPNGMLIRTRGGVDYKFVVWGRERLVNIIKSRIDKV